MSDTVKKKSLFIVLLKVYLFLAPLDFLPIIPNFSISKLLIFLPVIGYVFELQRYKSLFLKKESLWLLLYIAAATISLFSSINMDASVSRIITLALNAGVIILLTTVDVTGEEIESLMKAMALSGWLLVALCLIYSDFEAMRGRMTVVINGAYQDPNDLCGFFIFPLAYYLFKFTNYKRNILSLVSVVVFITVILLTGSRGGLIAALVCGVVIILSNATKSKSAFWKTLLLIAFVLLALYYLWELLPSEITDRFTKEFNETNAGSNRFLIWESIVDKFKGSSLYRQVFGYGVATVTMYTPTRQVAHNIWLETIIEMGVIGFIAIFVMYLKYAIEAIKCKKHMFVFAAFCGYMTMCFSLSLFSYKPIWNILMLIILLASAKKKQEN